MIARRTAAERALAALLPALILLAARWTASAQAVSASPPPPRPGDLPVEIVSTWTAYDWNGSAWKESVRAKTVVEKFSPEGLLLSSELSLLVGGIYEKTEYLYSGDRLLKAVARDGTGALRRVTTYEYRGPGKGAGRRALTLSADGEWVNEEFQEFDAKGRVSRVEAFNGSGTALLERRLEYDGRGRLTKEYAKAAQGGLAWVKECEYGKDDAAGAWLVRVDWESYRGSWPHQRYAVRRAIRYAPRGQEASP